MARHVMPVLAELGAAHPRLELDVRLEDRYADLVAEDIDLAVRGGDLEDSSLIARPVADVVYVVCAAPAYLQRRGLPRKPADLANHEWIHHEQSPRQLSGRHAGRAFHVRIRGRLRANSGPAVLELLRAGAGLALAPLWEVVDDLRGGKLKVVLPQSELKRSRVHLVSPAGRERLPKVRTASRRIAERLSAQRWDRIDPRWATEG
jgi:DNA-binding transcriptional LysR family regulator